MSKPAARSAGLALLCAATCTHAAPPSDLDTTVARAMQAFGAPGLALAIVEPGAPPLAKGFGLRSLQTREPVTAHSAFPIGSETKAFTAAALAILVDRHRLSWSDRVVDRLPGFQMYDPYASAHMTVRDLLAHRSGLGLGEGDLLVVPGTNRSRADIVHALRYLKPVTGFREKFAYDNILYIVAGALIEAVSGQSWEDFVTTNIFHPLGMADSRPQYDPSAANAVALHARTGTAIRGTGAETVLAEPPGFHTLDPAGGINASATDLATWMQTLLDHGRIPGGGRLVSDQQAGELWNPVVVVPPEEFQLPPALSSMQPALQTYALGWFVEDYHGHILIEHSGAVFGAIAMLYIIPDKHVGLSVTVNSEDSGARRAVMFHLLDHYLDLPPSDWIGKLQVARAASIASAEAAPKSAPADASAAAKPDLPLARYAGTYTDPWYGTITMTLQSPGALQISFDRTPGMQGTLTPAGHNRFRTHFTNGNIENAMLDFHVDHGRIASLTMAAISPLADFSFDYQDLHFTVAPAVP
jgi:CubicO group peptidase (beta-lactamase class C family)